MRVDYIVLAIPVFFALIGVELLVARRGIVLFQKRVLYEKGADE